MKNETEEATVAWICKKGDRKRSDAGDEGNGDTWKEISWKTKENKEGTMQQDMEMLRIEEELALD